MADDEYPECAACGRAPRAPGNNNFCRNCLDDGNEGEHYGRCYECRSGRHRHCLGVPCGCSCPATDKEKRTERVTAIADAESAVLAAAAAQAEYRYKIVAGKPWTLTDSSRYADLCLATDEAIQRLQKERSDA